MLSNQLAVYYFITCTGDQKPWFLEMQNQRPSYFNCIMLYEVFVFDLQETIGNKILVLKAYAL